MRIAIANHSGARNRGCDALIEGILAGLQTQPSLSGAPVDLHTADYQFDKWRWGNRMSYYNAYIHIGNARHSKSIAVNRLAYKTAMALEKFLPDSKAQFRDLSSARDANVIISTGGDVFTSDYGNCRGHLSYLQLGTPVFLCGHSIGPFSKSDEEYFKKSSDNLMLLTARESRSYNYVKSLNLNCRVEQTADVAFLLPVMERDDTVRYARKFLNIDLNGRKLLGLSISELITKYSKEGREESLNQIARFIDEVNAQGYTVIVIPHVTERKFTNDDQKACFDVMRKVKSSDANIMMTGLFTSIEAKSVIGLCDVLLGARTHTTIASMSQGVPTVSIAYSRKAYGIMEDFYGPELSKKLTLSSENFSTQALLDAMTVALQAGRQEETAAKMKKLAIRNFECLTEEMAKKRA